MDLVQEVRWILVSADDDDRGGVVYMARQVRQFDGLTDNYRVRGKIRQALQGRPFVGCLMDDKTRFPQAVGIDRAVEIHEQDDTAHRAQNTGLGGCVRSLLIVAFAEG